MSGLWISITTTNTVINFTLSLDFHRHQLGSNLLGRHTCSEGSLAQTPGTRVVLCTLFGPLAIMPLSSDDAIRVWDLTEMVRIAGSCKLQGFEVAIHSSPVKKLVYIGLYGTQLAVPDGRILYARNHLTVYKSRACLVFLEPDQETRVGEMLRKALADHNFVVAGEAVPIHRDDSPHRMLLNGHVGSQLATRLAQVHAWIRNITGGAELSRRGAQYHLSLDGVVTVRGVVELAAADSTKSTSKPPQPMSEPSCGDPLPCRRHSSGYPRLYRSDGVEWLDLA